MASIFPPLPALAVTAPPQLLSVGQQQASKLMPELVILAVASLLCVALYWAGSYALVSFIAASLMLVLNAVANFRMVVADPAMLLTPLFGARLSAMVVFGVGALFHQFLPLNLQMSQDFLYPASAAEAAKVILLWLLSMTMLIAGVVIATRLHRKPRRDAPGTDALGAIPLTIGLWMFVLSFSFSTIKIIVSTITPLVLPGIVESLVLALQLCGIFLIAQHVGASRKALIVMIAGLVGLILSALLFHAKTLALYPALFAMLGMLSNRVTWRRTLVSAALILMIFVVISPAVTYARERMVNEYGQDGSGSLSDRWRYVVDYAGGDRIREDDMGFTISRLNYVMPTSFVMAQYEQGVPSDRLVTSGYILIPRLVWPDKPITSGSGLEVNQLMGIQTTNQIGVTIFGDLYWNIGWYALVLAALMGLYIGVVSIMCRTIVSRGDWLLLPFALASMRLGLNLDSDFTSGFMAPAVINLILYGALRFVAQFFGNLREGATSPA